MTNENDKRIIAERLNFRRLCCLRICSFCTLAYEEMRLIEHRDVTY